MEATIELKCKKIHGYSLRAAMEIKILMKVDMSECECKSVSVIRIRSEHAMNGVKIFKFIFYKYMHVGVECKIEQMNDVIIAGCKMRRERLMQVRELTRKLEQLEERCSYVTRIVHIIEKSCDTHRQQSLTESNEACE